MQVAGNRGQVRLPQHLQDTGQAMRVVSQGRSGLFAECVVQRVLLFLQRLQDLDQIGSMTAPGSADRGGLLAGSSTRNARNRLRISSGLHSTASIPQARQRSAWDGESLADNATSTAGVRPWRRSSWRSCTASS